MEFMKSIKRELVELMFVYDEADHPNKLVKCLLKYKNL